MGIQLSIPDSVTRALRLPKGEQQARLATELALSLYEQEILSFGKARELAGLSKYEFGKSQNFLFSLSSLYFSFLIPLLHSFNNYRIFARL